MARQEMQKRHEDSFANPRPSPSSAQRRRGGRDEDKGDASSENSTSSRGTSAANTRKQ